jgi:DNA-binding XRE family transcriptional regulator
VAQPLIFIVRPWPTARASVNVIAVTPPLVEHVMPPARNGFSRKSEPLDHAIEPLASFPGPLDHDFRNSENEVQALRNRLRMSQTEFAQRFGFPVATLRNWESGKRAPRGPSLALLRIIAYHPAIAMRAMIRARRR